MTSETKSRGKAFIEEMKEFGTFSKKTQRYIRQTLDVAYRRGDAVATWGRTDEERQNIRTQIHNYNLLLGRIRLRMERGKKIEIGQVENMMGPLVALATFDLSMGCIPHFGCFRFLYERLFGPDVRPWLPAVYVAAAAIPVVEGPIRISHLRSISEVACRAEPHEWSKDDPEFMPEWVDKVEPPPKQLPSPA